MKNRFVSALLCLLFTLSFTALLPAQEMPPPGQSPPASSSPTNSPTMPGYDSYSVFQEGLFGNVFTGGLGITSFGGKTFYTLNLSPEIALGKVGIGLDINLRIGQDGNLRQEDWDDGVSSYLRLIRYIRYGNKREETYARFGQLDAARLGHGTIMYLYRNNASYDARRVGLEFDLDFGQFGFESMVSDLSTFNIVGLRPFYRPLVQSGIPIVSGLELGATVVMDFNENSSLTATPQSLYPATDNGQQLFDPALARRRGNLGVFGFDAGLPLVRLPIVDVDVYADFIKFFDYGSGGVVGISGALKNLGDLVTLSARLEHRVFGDNFQFAYFDGLYEQDRFQTLVRDTTFNRSYVRTRANDLAFSSTPGPGVYGDLGASVLGKLLVFGSYQRLYATPKNGQLHLSAGLKELIPNVLFRADYYKRDIGFETELFTLDDRSTALVELGYYPYPYLLLSLVYQWTFSPIRDGGDRIIGYEPIRRIEPRVSFSFKF